MSGAQQQTQEPIGTLTPQDNGGMIGKVKSLGCNLQYEGLDLDFWLAPVLNKTKEKAPDFNIEAKAHHGKVVVVGAAWQKRDKKNKPYISMTFKDGSLPHVIYANAWANENGEGFVINS